MAQNTAMDVLEQPKIVDVQGQKVVESDVSVYVPLDISNMIGTGGDLSFAPLVSLHFHTNKVIFVKLFKAS